MTRSGKIFVTVIVVLVAAAVYGEVYLRQRELRRSRAIVEEAR